jgi:multimeric flavodoxin WrbA
VKNEMQKHGSVEFKEYFLPQDMPEFCCGCYSCFFKGESFCPHAKYVQPIVADMLGSDGFIITSPVYVLSVNGGVKAFLDHLAYMFLVHRPQKEMFSKKALIISTTAGAGTGKVIKTISTILKYWGVNKIYSCGFSMYSATLDDMAAKRKNKCTKKLTTTAERFFKDITSQKQHQPYLIQRFIFMISRRMIKGDNNKERKPDRDYWQNNGWFDGKTPFKKL